MASAEVRPKTITICGGGNASHVFAILASALDNVRVNVLTLFQDEAERWTNAMEAAGGMTVRFTGEGDRTVTAKPSLVTKDPAQAIPNSDVIVITVPAFAHGAYLEAVNEHLNQPAVLAVVPGSSGIEFQFARIFGDKASTIALIGLETLPWACRFQEYGVSVEVLGTKSMVSGTRLVGAGAGVDAPASFEQLQRIIGERPVLRDEGHIIGSTLLNHPEVHCAIMYDRWADWDGTPMGESPLFYQGITQAGADLMAELSDEQIRVGEAVKAAIAGIDVELIHINKWFMDSYGEQAPDTSSLFAIITTNPGYNGLRHPCKTTEEGTFVPDFNHRYLGEDIPYGFVVIKGVALLVGVETPVLDRVLLWAQERMGKEYMVDGQLTGRDMGQTRAPQVYGFTTLAEIF